MYERKEKKRKRGRPKLESGWGVPALSERRSTAASTELVEDVPLGMPRVEHF